MRFEQKRRETRSSTAVGADRHGNVARRSHGVAGYRASCRSASRTAPTRPAMKIVLCRRVRRMTAPARAFSSDPFLGGAGCGGPSRTGMTGLLLAAQPQRLIEHLTRSLGGCGRWCPKIIDELVLLGPIFLWMSWSVPLLEVEVEYGRARRGPRGADHRRSGGTTRASTQRSPFQYLNSPQLTGRTGTATAGGALR